MAKSKIEWTEETWNPIVGCSLKSPGCTHCYAMPMAARIEAINAALVAEGKPPQSPQYDGTTKKRNGHAVWTGKLAMAPDSILLRPLKRKKPTKYFVNSMGDLFHEDCPGEWIDKCFIVMAEARHHTFQILTKRAERMRRYMTEVRDKRPIMAGAFPWPLPNVWLGVSAERQQEWDERKEHLRATPAAVRFASFEPLLGSISEPRPMSDFLHWAIVGGESGPDARPMHPDWARSLRDQCAAANVPFFFKQWGNWAHEGQIGADGKKWLWSLETESSHNVGKKNAGRLLDGVEHNAMPAGAR